MRRPGNTRGDFVALTVITVITVSRLCSPGHCLSVSPVRVPPEAEEGDTVTFQCEYQAEPGERPELDIKWYRDTAPAPFMLFLPAHWSRPKVLEEGLRDHIVTEETGGLGGTMSWSIVNVTRRHAGIYTCKVSTNSEEFYSSSRIDIIGIFNKSSSSMIYNLGLSFV